MTKTRGISTFVLAVTCLLPSVVSLNAEILRYALVVGNAAYTGDAALKNPVNDATDVASSLTRIGWNVTLVTDADRRVFNRAVTTFRDTLTASEGADALFYYAGHGMQVDGTNYLIPVKTDFETVDDIRADAIGIQSVTAAIEQARAGASLIILDACRDNPFARKMTRSLGGTRGLTVVQGGGGSKGSAIMFSTSPGDVAMDGTGRNGIFTAALLKYIDSDLKIEELFKKVTGDVRDMSAGAQKPWINASLSNDFYFISDSIRAAKAAEESKAAAAARQAELAKAAETARAAEAVKTEQVRMEAEAVKKAAAEVLAAAAAKSAADQNRPKGKARIESSVAGTVYAGTDLLGEVGPDSPLMADSLATGKQDFRFVSPGNPEESRTATITEKAYVTVVFGKKTESTALNAAQAGTGTQSGPAALWIRKSVD